LCCFPPVQVVNWIADRRIIQEFTSRLVTRVLSAEERSLRKHLDAAVNQGDFIAAAIVTGRFQFGEPALTDFVSGTLAAAPQVYGLIVCDRDGQALRVVRGAAAGTEFAIDHFNIATDSQFAALADQIRTHKDPYWGAPIYRPQWQDLSEPFRPYLERRHIYGFAAIGITTRALSTLAKELSDPPRSVAFMLYEQDRVLAHPLITEGSPRQSENASFPLLRSFGDPVIENLASLPPVHDIGLAAPPGVLAREPSVGDERYFVFAREITAYREFADHGGHVFPQARGRWSDQAVLLGDDLCARIAGAIINRRSDHGRSHCTPDPSCGQGRDCNRQS
jgi:adenylate cyclase